MDIVKNININGTVSKLSTGVYDITEQNSGRHFSGIAEVLTGASSYIPEADRTPGMQIKFIQDNEATYFVERTDSITEQPEGSALDNMSYIQTGTYTSSELTIIFPTLPQEDAPLTYYYTTTLDGTTTYTIWTLALSSASSSEYVQYRLMSSIWSIAVSDWQGVDSEPTWGSENLVEAGGVVTKLSPFYNAIYNEISEYQTYNRYYVDANGVVRSSGTFIIRYIALSRPVRVKISFPKLANFSVCVSNTIPQLNGTVGNILLYSSNSKERTAIESTGDYSYLIWAQATNYTDNIVFIEDTLGIPKEYLTEADLQGIYNKFTQQDLLEFRKRNIALKSDLRVPIYVDWMQFSHALSGINSIDVFNVVSATADTITLSATDAAKFEAKTPAIVVFPNNIYKLVFFNPVSDNTNIVKRYWDATDLSTAIKVQSVFDTVMSVNGIHLSQYGYLALAQFTASELAKQNSIRNKNFIAGVDFYSGTLSDGVVYEDGIEVATYGYNFTPSAQNYFEKTDNSRINFTNGYGFLTYYLAITFSNNNNYFEVKFPCKGKGFIEIQVGQTYDINSSRITAQLLIDDVLADTWELIGSQTKYTFENRIVGESITVKFISHDVSTSSRGHVSLYSINFYEPYPNNYTIGSGTNIAVLGDSWTQFPALKDALPEMTGYNSLVVRPDGTVGDGCGYFTKELARITGANVDNWGKGGMRADNWGLVKIDELLSYKRYDYVIVEFFINDSIAGQTRTQWLNNISTLVNKIKMAGAVPIVILPCRNNGQSTYQNYRECILRGLEAISY